MIGNNSPYYHIKMCLQIDYARSKILLFRYNSILRSFVACGRTVTEGNNERKIGMVGGEKTSC
jgi:hypothetical protein